MRSNSQLDGIVTVVDAKHVIGALEQEMRLRSRSLSPTSSSSTRPIWCPPKNWSKSVVRIRAINPTAAIRETQRCAVELSELLDRDAFNLARVLELEPGFLEEEHAHEHDDRVSKSLTHV